MALSKDKDKQNIDKHKGEYPKMFMYYYKDKHGKR